MKKSRSRLAFSAMLLAAMGVVVAVIAVTAGKGPATSSPVKTRAAVGVTGERTVFVSRGVEPAPSAPGSRLHAMRLSGPVPNRRSTATIMSDESCAADGRGISHCINRMRLANGKILTVRHPHRMMEVPCLSPGEHVVVRPA